MGPSTPTTKQQVTVEYRFCERGRCVAYTPECVSWGVWQHTCERTSQFHELSTNGSEQQRAKRGTSQSSLIAHLVDAGLAAEENQVDRILAYAGIINGPADLSETIDETVYGR